MSTVNKREVRDEHCDLSTDRMWGTEHCQQAGCEGLNTVNMRKVRDEHYQQAGYGALSTVNMQGVWNLTVFNPLLRE